MQLGLSYAKNEVAQTKLLFAFFKELQELFCKSFFAISVCKAHDN
jgi:hypothetical protein